MVYREDIDSRVDYGLGTYQDIANTLFTWNRALSAVEFIQDSPSSASFHLNLYGLPMPGVMDVLNSCVPAFAAVTYDWR